MTAPFLTADETSDRLQSLIREYNALRLAGTATTQQQLADALNQLDAATGALEAKDAEIARLTGLCLDLLGLVNDRSDAR